MFRRKQQLPEALEGVFLGRYESATIESLTRGIDTASDGPITAIGNMTFEPSTAAELHVFGLTRAGIVFTSLGMVGAQKPQRDGARFLPFDVVAAFAYVPPRDDDDESALYEHLHFTLGDQSTVKMYPKFPKSKAIMRELAATLPARLGMSKG